MFPKTGKAFECVASGLFGQCHSGQTTYSACIYNIHHINVEADAYRPLLEQKLGCPAAVQRGSRLSHGASFAGGSVAAPISPGFSDV